MIALLIVLSSLVVGVTVILITEHRRDRAAGMPSIRAFARNREKLIP